MACLVAAQDGACAESDAPALVTEPTAAPVDAGADVAEEATRRASALDLLKALPPAVATVVLGFCDGAAAFTLVFCMRPPGSFLPDDALEPLWTDFVTKLRSERRRLMDEGDLSFDISDSPWPRSLGDVDDDPPLVAPLEFLDGEAQRNARLWRQHAGALRHLLARLTREASPDDGGGDDGGDGERGVLILAPLVLFGGGAALDLALECLDERKGARRVSFGGCGPWLTDAVLARFLRRRSSLEVLDCHSSPRLSSLAAIARHCGNIVYLCLSHCKQAVTDEGALLLARGLARHGTPKLEHLSLAGATALSDRGVNDLAKHLRQAPLVDLCLSGCHRCTDKSMAHIALDFIYLKRIKFCGAYRITANGLRRLMNQNSTCLTYNNASDFGLLFGLQPKFSPRRGPW